MSEMSERVEEIRRLHPDGHRTRLPQGADHTCDVCDLLTALAQAERENERLTKEHGQVTRANGDLAIQLVGMQARTRALEAALERIIGMSAIPPTCACGRPNGLGAIRMCAQNALTEPTPPAGGQG